MFEQRNDTLNPDAGQQIGRNASEQWCQEDERDYLAEPENNVVEKVRNFPWLYKIIISLYRIVLKLPKNPILHRDFRV